MTIDFIPGFSDKDAPLFLFLVSARFPDEQDVAPTIDWKTLVNSRALFAPARCNHYSLFLPNLGHDLLRGASTDPRHAQPFLF
jgi:hypothetical protein